MTLKPDPTHMNNWTEERLEKTAEFGNISEGWPEDCKRHQIQTTELLEKLSSFLH